VLKTVSFFLQGFFLSDFILSGFFKLCFLGIQMLTAFFSLTVHDFVVFIRSSDRKFSEDSKNVIKNMIWSLQVGFKPCSNFRSQFY